MTSQIFKNSFLVIASLLIAMLLSEMFFRLFLPQTFEVHPPGMYAGDQEVGYVLTPGFKGTIRRAEFEIPFQVNQFGLRGKEFRSPRPNTFRILILGDSQAFGFGVRDNETFSFQLEELLSQHYVNHDIQVLNGGVPGYGTVDQLAFLKSRGLLLKPGLIILQFLSVNDFQENRSAAGEWAEVQDGVLMVKTDVLDPEHSLPLWRRLQDWLKSNIHLARLLSDRLGYLAMRWGILGKMESFWGEDFSEEDAKITENYLLQIAEGSRKLSAYCIFLYTTGQVHVFSDTHTKLRSADFMEVTARKADIPWINSQDFLRNRTDKFDLYYRMDGHWTAAGHQAIAEILFENIIKLNLIPEVNKTTLQE